jgi:hypothetical protein
MAELKISDLNPKGENIAATDLFVISQDMGGGVYETKSITGDEILGAVSPTAVAVRNTTGATIYKGTIVYISGTSGGKALISKAKADIEATSSKTLGVVQANIANNANGNVLTSGLLVGLDTRTTATNPFTSDTLVIGDNIYLSPTTAGYITNVKPIAPNNMVSIGKVLETSGTTGQILYEIINGFELGELHDVNTTGAATNDVLSLFADGVWKPKAISSGITIGTTPITSGVAGRVLFEGSGNVVQEDAGLFWDNVNKRLGVGTSVPSALLQINGSVSASSAIARGGLIAPILTASANNDVLVGLDIQPTFTNGGFTGVNNFGLRVANNTGIQAGIITGFPNLRLTTVGISSNISFSLNQTSLEIARFTPTTGNLMLQNGGTFTDSGAKLHITAQGALSTDIAFRIRNSADTLDIIRANGAGEVFVGLGAGNVSTGANNSFFGKEAGRNNTTGFQNTANGIQALFSNTTGGNNIAQGVNSGRFIADGTTSNTITNNSIYLGNNTKALANNQTNQIVIGHEATGLGSNTAVLGNDSITLTGLKGNVAIGATTASAKLDVRAQGALSTDVAFRVRNSADTANLFSIDGLGEINWSNGTSPAGQRVFFNSIQFKYGGAGFGSRVEFNNSGIQLDYAGNISLGTPTNFGGGTGQVIMKSATAPTSNGVDQFHLYSADITAGNAAPHFRTENGSVIKLYKQDLPTSPTNAELATFLSNLGLANLI